jgi:hypothetical protein
MTLGSTARLFLPPATAMHIIERDAEHHLPEPPTAAVPRP